MIRLAIALGFGGLVSAQVTAGGPTSPLLIVLAFLSSAGFLTLIWQVYLRFKRGGAEDEEVVSRVANQVVAGAHELLDEYRIQIEVSKRQLADYLSQLTDLNRLLGQANERIARLEHNLEETKVEAEGVRVELVSALKRRTELTAEVATLRGRIDELERHDNGRAN